jgi:signal peptidase I
VVRVGAIAAGLGSLLSVAWLAARCERVEVTGASMAPTLLEGDRLVVVSSRRLRPGDLVVLPDPRTAERPLVKRLAALPHGSARVGDVILEAGTDEVIVLGDNPSASTDSRTLGPVPLAAITGRAVYRYHPPERAGRLQPSGRATRR